MHALFADEVNLMRRCNVQFCSYGVPRQVWACMSLSRSTLEPKGGPGHPRSVTPPPQRAGLAHSSSTRPLCGILDSFQHFYNTTIMEPLAVFNS